MSTLLIKMTKRRHLKFRQNSAKLKLKSGLIQKGTILSSSANSCCSAEGKVKMAECQDDIPPPEFRFEPYPIVQNSSGPSGADTISTRLSVSIEKRADDNNDYFIAHAHKLSMLFNDSFREHAKYSPGCMGNLLLEKTHERLISSSRALKCTHCDYFSCSKDLYIKSGNQSTLNMALGFSLLKSSIGASQCREIFLSLGIYPGSVHGLQNIINYCGRIVVKLSQTNMARERQNAKFRRELCITLDGWYPTKFCSGPWQASMQTTFTALDSKTNKVLVIYIASKLCPEATKLRNKGIKVDCPGNHPGCTANLDKFATIGQEGFYANEVATILKNDGLNVTDICTDADSKITKGFAKVYPEAKNFKDKSHICRSLKRALVRATFSKNMFTPKTVKLKKRAQTRFAGDLRYRIEAEFTAFLNKTKRGTHSEKMEKMKSHFQTLTPKIISCFKGNHRQCKNHSLICTDKKRWSLKHEIKPTRGDEALLKKIILEKRLGNACLEATVTDASTQGNEAFNRTLSKTAPKTTTHSLNFSARMHAAVLIHNLGTAACSLQLLNAAGHRVTSQIKRHIAMNEIERQRRISIAKSSVGKSKRAKLRNYKQKLHDEKFSGEHKDADADDEDDYKKDVGLPKN